MVGQVAGGGRTEKPLLKAGNAYHKYKVKRNSWPKVGYLNFHLAYIIIHDRSTNCWHDTSEISSTFKFLCIFAPQPTITTEANLHHTGQWFDKVIYCRFVVWL